MLQINSKNFFTFISIKITIIILCLCLSKFSAKALDKKVIEVLKKDQLIMDNYSARYRYLSCKLIIYSKLKYMFELEKIDVFANVTENKKDFIDIFYEEMLKKCNKLNIDTDVKFNFPFKFLFIFPFKFLFIFTLGYF
jgi:hypothetical protein